jgi:hypothetical protein
MITNSARATRLSLWFNDLMNRLSAPALPDRGDAQHPPGDEEQCPGDQEGDGERQGHRDHRADPCVLTVAPPEPRSHDEVQALGLVTGAGKIAEAAVKKWFASGSTVWPASTPGAASARFVPRSKYDRACRHSVRTCPARTRRPRLLVIFHNWSRQACAVCDMALPAGRRKG